MNIFICNMVWRMVLVVMALIVCGCLVSSRAESRICVRLRYNNMELIKFEGLFV